MKLDRHHAVILSLLVGALTAAAPAWTDPPSMVGRVGLVSGTVSFQSGSMEEWAPATLNYPMTAGDRLWTDRGGRTEITLPSTAIRLDSGTEIAFLNFDDQTVQIQLSVGSVSIRLESLDPDNVFEIATPNASVSLLEPGNYRLDVQGDGTTRIVVRHGTAEVAMVDATFDVPAGRTVTLSGADSGAYNVISAPAVDQWDRWSMDRDAREDRALSQRHVSNEMIGAEDLDESGTWLQVAGYGSVWSPRQVPANWAPYRFGHWAWVEPWGWTWIDNASWGFAPFHYGRWAFLSARWVWIPGTVEVRPVYAPALVVFVGGNGWRPTSGEGVGWFPLGPREIYVPPYQVSNAYVQRVNNANVANFTLRADEQINVSQTVYVNRTAPRAMTFVSHDVFVQARPVSGGMLPVTNTEISRAPVLGMTANVAPQRESVLARPQAVNTVVAHPPAQQDNRRVYSRIAPLPAPVPFAARQQTLNANPGHPLSSDELLRLQRNTPQPPRTGVVVVAPRPAQQPVRQVPAPVQVKPQAAQQQPARQVPAPVQVKPQAAQQQPARTLPAPVLVKPQAAQQQPARTLPAPAQVKPDNGERAKVSALIDRLRTSTLPQADQRLAAARAARGIRLDVNAVAAQLSAARAELAKAEQLLAQGNTSQAMQSATSVQSTIDGQLRLISAATQAASSGQNKQ
jgi:hypothetical protein